jgi:serine/threonine-protein kinase
MILKEGDNIQGIYEIDRFLGEGSFAEVYRVNHKFLGRQALKVFKTAETNANKIKEKLEEAVLLSKIGHPNIIRVFDAGIINTTDGQRGYFTMEYVSGGTLDTWIATHEFKRISLKDSIDIIQQICTGLSVAHKKKPPIIHRDIKPQNILINQDLDDLRIKISDFGLAKEVNPLTLLASAKGTPVFKAPECLNQNMDSCAGDVWAIGIIFYILVTRKLPFPIESRDALSSDIWQKYPMVPPSEYNGRIDDELEKIILRALEIKLEERYPNAMAMLKDITLWKNKYQNTI